MLVINTLRFSLSGTHDSKFFWMVLSVVVILIQKYENARGMFKLNSFRVWRHALHATAIGEKLKISLKRLSFFNGTTSRQMMLPCMLWRKV